MNEESATIRSFLIRGKRDRMVELLCDPKRRAKALASLAHFRGLDPKWVVPIPPSAQNVAEIEVLLRTRGAGETCYVISESKSLDGKRLGLSEALENVVGHGMGTLISCKPGQLAFFEGEGPSDRCILARLGI